MSNDPEDLPVEYIYQPAPDASDRLAQAWELILELILEDLGIEPESNADLDSPIRYNDPSGHSSCVGANADDSPQCVKKNPDAYDPAKNIRNFDCTICMKSDHAKMLLLPFGTEQCNGPFRV